MHPLIVTLAVAAVVQGITLLYTLMPIGGMPDGFDVLAFGRVFGIPIGATFAVLCFAVVAFVLAETGRADRFSPSAASPPPRAWLACR